MSSFITSLSLASKEITCGSGLQFKENTEKEPEKNSALHGIRTYASHWELTLGARLGSSIGSKSKWVLRRHGFEAAEARIFSSCVLPSNAVNLGELFICLIFIGSSNELYFVKKLSKRRDPCSKSWYFVVALLSK